MTTRTSNRPPFAAAAVLLIVILAFGAATFVAGLAVGRGPSTAAVPSFSPDPTPTPGPTPILETISCTAPSETFALLCETYARITSDYVDEVSDEELVEGAVEGMIEALPDPYSGYLPPEQYSSALDDLSGEFSGIGAEVGIRNLVEGGDDADCTVVSETCAMVIVAPISGSPAEAAGLRAADIVLEVDGEPTAGTTLSDQVYKVRGEAGTDVTLTVERDGRSLDITITRAVISLQEVESEMLSDGIGYLALTSFTDRAPTRLREALGQLLDDGSTRIVLDLRNNPGGFLVAARDVASQFVPAGELLFTVESGDEVQRWESEAGGLAQAASIEVVVLINGGSASASEIVAAALGETDRATLVGEPTFGKNTVQIWSELPNGAGLRLTTDRWFTPSHGSVADGGVQPDVEVASPDDPTTDEDPQLDRAIEILTD